MKKMLLSTLSCGLVFGFSMLANAQTNSGMQSVVSIDSIKIMQESSEGKKITAQIQKDVEKFQEQVKSAQKQLTDLQEDLTKKAKVLSAEAVQEKTEELAEKKKSIEGDLAGKEEALRRKIQRQQLTLRDKQMATVGEMAQKNNWPILVDKNTPGVLYVADTTDRTKEVLAAVDAKYNSENVTKAVDAKGNVASTVKTAAKGSTPVKDVPAAKTIKTA